MGTKTEKILKRFFCGDCGRNTFYTGIKEYYMLLDRVWMTALKAGKDTHMLCIGCVEARLKRELTPADFATVALNHTNEQSDRLRKRIKGKQHEN